jgi:hypothetical protein
MIMYTTCEKPEGPCKYYRFWLGQFNKGRLLAPQIHDACAVQVAVGLF